MKKTFCLCGIGALMLGASSCGSSSDSSIGNTFGDSLSVYMGRVNGMQFADRIQTIPESDKANFKKDSFIRGMKEALNADTTDVGYLYGLSVGLNLANQLMMLDRSDVPVDRDKFINNFAAAFKTDSVDQIALSSDMGMLQSLMDKAQAMMREKQQAEAAAAQAAKEKEAEANKEAGAAFVEKEKSADSSIKTTESGLSYKVVNQGTGALPTENDRVKVKYTGKLTDGTVFDSSNDEAVEFGLMGVIPGFAEGLKMMNKGSKYILYIPSDLGYGVSGTPDGSIPPGSTLIFEVEVEEIVPAK